MGLLHASILNTLPSVKLTALCDKSALIRRLCRKLFDEVEVVDDLEMLSDLNLDIVFVTTPIPSHFAITKTVYSKGIAQNVFVEKTLASTYAKAKELCELAQTFKGINMVGYMKRFGVTFRKARDLLSQEALGEVISFDAYAYSSDFLGVKKDPKVSTSRGGVLEDLGAHTIDLALWFFCDLKVESVNLEASSNYGSEDFAHFTVRKPDGSEGQFKISWCKEEYRLPEFGFMIKGSKGNIAVNDDKIELDLNGKKSVWYRHDLGDNVDFLLGAPEYYREDEYFVKSVVEGNVVEPNFCTASKVDYIIDQVRKRSGKNE